MFIYPCVYVDGVDGTESLKSPNILPLSTQQFEARSNGLRKRCNPDISRLDSNPDDDRNPTGARTSYNLI